MPSANLSPKSTSVRIDRMFVTTAAHRLSLILALVFALVIQCFSQELPQPKKTFAVLKTTDGVELRDVTVTALDQTGVALSHADGTGRFDWSRIPKADQLAMGFDPDRIAAQFAAATAARADAIQKQKEAAVAAERIKLADAWKHIYSITEVLSDKPKFLGETFAVEARVNISDNYPSFYGAAREFGPTEAKIIRLSFERDYYSFDLADPVTFKSKHAYMERSKADAAKLRDQLLKGSIKRVFLVEWHGSRGDLSEDYFTIIEVRTPQN